MSCIFYHTTGEEVKREYGYDNPTFKEGFRNIVLYSNDRQRTRVWYRCIKCKEIFFIDSDGYVPD